ERNAEMDRHAAQLMQLRAQLVGRDSIADSLRTELEQLRASIPGLETRDRLAQRLQQMDERERALRDQIQELKQEVAGPEAAPSTAKEAAPVAAAQPAEHVVHLHARLADRAVLCVGGRSGNVASYRSLIERVGAQFSHHDGGLEDNANKLESSL